MEPVKEKVEISVYDEINNESAISTEDGDRIFKRIDMEFQNNKQVVLEFSKIKIIISAFFNAAIGQLYSKYKSDFLNTNLFIEGLSLDDIVILRKVVERAKEYFLDRGAFEDTVKGEIGDE